MDSNDYNRSQRDSVRLLDISRSRCPELYDNPDLCLNFLAEARFKEVREEPIIFHCFWSGELTPKQLLSVKSVVATQSLAHVVMWLNSRSMPSDTKYLRAIERIAEVREYVMDKEYRSCETLRVAAHVSEYEDMAAQSDTFRSVLLANYGGVYFDLDVCFLRDISRLIDGDFAYEWETSGYINTAVMSLLASGQVARQVLKEGLLQMSFHPWKLSKIIPALPCLFFDPGWTNCSHRFSWENFFKASESGPEVENFIDVLFAYHWHNQWGAEFERGSKADWLDNYYSDIIGACAR